MKSPRITLIVLCQFCAYLLCGQDSIKLMIPGLLHPVTIYQDRWGVAHIYAANEQDLFFAQGYNAAKDRLFQFEIFRRQASGTVAEILGEREINRDIGSRLFKFRGDINQEMNHYHAHGALIIKSFVRGVNAYIKQVLDNKEKLPIEFQWLSIKPGFWTPEIVISRHNGLLGNIQFELNVARSVSKIGTQRVQDIMNFHPHLPLLKLDSLLTKEALDEDILKLYNAYRTSIQFQSSNLLGMIDQKNGMGRRENMREEYTSDKSYEGSNNWVINGKKSSSGFPMLANDPHRSITIPSLRYITHLQAPGWNVIGGGEPILPGVSIGHNEYGAWGLTIFETDIEDLYVYKINPLNKNQYWHRGRWVTMKSIKDTIPIKDHKPQVVSYQYTIHGPVTFIDTIRHLAYAVRCAWLKPGCAPYLASLRMDQARNWNEFKQACKYAYVPAENMVWADKQGNIGWQTVGITPIRNNHSGMVPVVDDMKNEWAGFLPILKRPSQFNPQEGFIATANENLIPNNYPYMNSVGYSWSDPFRGARIREALNEKNASGISDFKSLQTDYQSLPARKIVPMIAKLSVKDSGLTYQKSLSSWNQVLSAESGMAGLYILIERSLTAQLLKITLPENYDDRKDNDVPITDLSMDWMIRYLDTVSNKNDILLYAFKLATQKMQSKYGANVKEWKYGDTSKFKHVYIQHALSTIVNETSKQKINTQHVIRGGNGNTVGSTSDNDNQTSGASFRIIVDCSDWDKTEAINTPGQSGDPDSKHYKDLFDIWSKDKYFPLYYSKKKINTVTDKIYELIPVKPTQLH